MISITYVGPAFTTEPKRAENLKYANLQLYTPSCEAHGILVLYCIIEIHQCKYVFYTTLKQH